MTLKKNGANNYEKMVRNCPTTRPRDECTGSMWREITNTNGENADSGTDAKKVLKVGTSADYPPFEYVDTAKSDEIIGFDIDLAKMLAEELGYELDIQDMDFNGLIPALQAKSIDFVIAGMDGDDEKRKQVVDFTEPYFTATNFVIFKKDSGIESIEDLKGKKVGAQTASIQEKSAMIIVRPVWLFR